MKDKKPPKKPRVRRDAMSQAFVNGYNTRDFEVRSLRDRIDVLEAKLRKESELLEFCGEWIIRLTGGKR